MPPEERRSPASRSSSTRMRSWSILIGVLSLTLLLPGQLAERDHQADDSGDHADGLEDVGRVRLAGQRVDVRRLDGCDLALRDRLRAGAVEQLVDGPRKTLARRLDLVLEGALTINLGHALRLPSRFPSMSRLQPGDTAPACTLTSEPGESVSLGDLAGRKVIVYFYAAAMTPGCTKQACDFTDSLDALRAQGYEVLGISPDKPEKLARFRERDSLTITLLSDPDKQVLDAYAAFGEKTMYGKTVQ